MMIMPMNNGYNGYQNNNNNYQNNNRGYGNNGQVGGPQKPDFTGRFQKIYGDDGMLSIELWIPMGTPKLKIYIASVIGKDPRTGMLSYEKKKPNELPTVYLSPAEVSALLALKDADPSTINVFSERGGRKISIMGSPSNVKVAIEDKTGTASCTFDSIFGKIGGWKLFMDSIELAYKKILAAKLPDDFLGSVTEKEPQVAMEAASEDITDDAPF